jgi:hypothetical protein
MIHHISISAKDPQRVANVIADLWQTQALPFPPFPGAFIVILNDGHGTAIEIAPIGTELLPGQSDQEVQPGFNEHPSSFTATHAALSVPVSEARIKEIAAREGWRAETFDRVAAFRLVEFWIEDRMLLELMTPDMVQTYLDFMTPQNYADFFGFELPQTQAKLVA